MSNRRMERVDTEMKQVIASFLVSGKVPLTGLVSVVRVQTSKDLRSAQVFVSVMGSENDQSNSLESLQQYAPEVQREVSRKIKMKFNPRLSFVLDRGFEQQDYIQRRLHEIAEDNEEGGSE